MILTQIKRNLTFTPSPNELAKKIEPLSLGEDSFLILNAS